MQFITPITSLLAQGVDELQGAMSGDEPALQLYVKIDSFLFGRVLNDQRFGHLDGAVHQLAAHSRNVWTAGARLVLSGQPYAVPAVVRTALESACYALLLNHDVSLVRVWQERHDDEDSLKKSKKLFRNAMEKAAHILNTKAQPLGDLVKAAYQDCIDDGAHPNTRGIPRTRKLLLGPNNFRSEYDETTDFYEILSIKSRDSMCHVAHIGLLMCHILCLTFMSRDELPVSHLDEMLKDFDSIIPHGGPPPDFSSIV
jgi:hypothetical protein